MATATWTCLWVSTPTMIFPQAGGRVKLVIAVCLLHRRTVGSAGREGGQDCDGRLTQAPIRSLPTRPVGHMDSRPAVPTDQRQGTKASRRARVRHRPGVLDAVALALNTRPRKTLGWRTPAEALDQLLRSPEQAGVASTP